MNLYRIEIEIEIQHQIHELFNPLANFLFAFLIFWFFFVHLDLYLFMLFEQGANHFAHHFISFYYVAISFTTVLLFFDWHFFH